MVYIKIIIRILCSLKTLIKENGVYNSFEDEQRDVKDVYKLPPKWLDIYDETKDELTKIKEISKISRF